MGCSPSRFNKSRHKSDGHRHHRRSRNPSIMSTTMSAVSTLSNNITKKKFIGLSAKDGGDDEVILFLKQKEVLPSTPTTIDISNDRSMIVIGHCDGSIELWLTMSDPIESLAKNSTGHFGRSISCVKFFDNFVISGGSDGTIIQWTLNPPLNIVRTFRGHESKVNQIITVGSTMFSTGYDRTLRSWSLVMYVESEEDITNTIVMPSMSSIRTIISQQESNNNRVADKRNGEIVEGRQESGVTVDEIEEDQRMLVDPSLICIFQGHTKSVYPIAFLPAIDVDELWEDRRYVGHFHDRDFIVTGSADCTARMWSISTGETLKVLTGHSSAIYSIVVDTNSGQNTIFTAGGDGQILAFDPITGELIRKLSGHEGAILVLKSHKTMLFSGSSDRTARSWVMEFGEETRVFRCGRFGQATSIDYLDGFVFVGCNDGSVRIFDSRSGSLLRLLSKGHNDSIIDVKVIRGKVFSVSIDGSFCVWSSKGIKLETVFGEKITGDDSDNESDLTDHSDDSQVTRAIEILDKFLRDR